MPNITYTLAGSYFLFYKKKLSDLIEINYDQLFRKNNSGNHTKRHTLKSPLDGDVSSVAMQTPGQNKCTVCKGIKYLLPLLF